MQRISEAINMAKAEHGSARQDIKTPKYKELCFEDFVSLLILECEILMSRHNPLSSFTIDENNTDIITSLWQYLTYNGDFKGNHHKGLMLMGGIGTGKTILIRGFGSAITRLTGRSFLFASAFEINRRVSEVGTGTLIKSPLIIDDLGKEPEMVNNYGTQTRPILQLFSERYEEGTVTFVTTNYNLNTLSKKYGEQTTDRFLDMFNFIEMRGASRRK